VVEALGSISVGNLSSTQYHRGFCLLCERW